VALRIRKRGFLLATDKEYEDGAVLVIAKRQEQLMVEMGRLDCELERLAAERPS
jgi:hypothetical protein